MAVLPFEVVGDTANAYFASGITDEIRSKLSQLPSLRLIASASSNQYLHTAKPQEQIGRELGVHYLLTGRVKWEQSPNGVRRVRVSPELVEVGQGSAPETRWQQSYDTTLADVFEVQSAVATRVADKLGVVLSPARDGCKLESRTRRRISSRTTSICRVRRSSDTIRRRCAGRCRLPSAPWRAIRRSRRRGHNSSLHALRVVRRLTLPADACREADAARLQAADRSRRSPASGSGPGVPRPRVLQCPCGR